MRRLGRWNDLPTDSHALIDAFVEKRLLVKDERDGEVVVEVALESLLRQWDELAEWLRAEASDLKDADILEQAAVAWERNARRDDWLLEGSRLTDAESLAAKPGFRRRLNPAREFLLASRQREDRHLEAERQRQESDLQAAGIARKRPKRWRRRKVGRRKRRRGMPASCGVGRGFCGLCWRWWSWWRWLRELGSCGRGGHGRRRMRAAGTRRRWR